MKSLFDQSFPGNDIFWNKRKMKTIIAAIFLLCIASSEVVVLNDKNFEELTQMSTGSTTGRWFVKFYAPWCGHCKSLAPVWEELSDIVAGEVNIAEVDATENPNLAKAYEIEGFPTLIYFENGKFVKYEGSRDLDSLQIFAIIGYADSDFEEVRQLPGYYEELIARLSTMANKYLAEKPFMTCMALMGSGAVVGIIFTLLFTCCCCKSKVEYDVSTDKKNN